MPRPLSATFSLQAHSSGRAWKPGGNYWSCFSWEETGLQSSSVEGSVLRPVSPTYGLQKALTWGQSPLLPLVLAFLRLPEPVESVYQGMK